ncbi:MAG: 4-(cytidine 5'-diphospho)-2-C-methyl-D-erythritol kinase [Candidatus Muiribacterium halophilum]|uniref:4-diphosphocytidyl-2-C-methyl-D-erythritol kinase n=1 Tax=Muiribacterium halophilum TaxID=2053465 RepID=A0A2N5ZHL1_MUIH1|nr:MAG: 4-(cytidine 5'-diphospho)-2-C-methyl-D-erythritol kinase [Candidatus Muirbacterium halophilum]
MIDIIKSPAKINLVLDLLYKRIDGFHEIDTIMAKIELFDEIKVSFSQELKVITSNGIRQQDNFVYKALKELEKLTKSNFELCFSIEKNIPMGAGLAGGSSNAGVCLSYVSKKYNIDIDKCLEVGEKVGSDINFFIFDHNFARCTGKGEIIIPFDVNLDYDVLLFFPDIHSDTPSVYKEFNIKDKPGLNVSKVILDIQNTQKNIQKDLFNCLEYPAFKLYPDLNDIYDKIRKVYPDIRMSGSGSTFFTLIKKNDSVKYTDDDIFIKRVDLIKG